jgi:hypothetical protein
VRTENREREQVGNRTEPRNRGVAAGSYQFATHPLHPTQPIREYSYVIRRLPVFGRKRIGIRKKMERWPFVAVLAVVVAPAKRCKWRLPKPNQTTKPPLRGTHNTRLFTLCLAAGCGAWGQYRRGELGGIGASGVSGSGVGCDELDSVRVVVRIPSQNPLISRFSAHRASLPLAGTSRIRGE